MFNLETLKNTAAQSATPQRLTLADMIGKQAVLPLPVGLHECKLVETPKNLASTSFRVVVESTVDQQKYSVTMNIGTLEQSDILMTNIGYLLEQLELPKTLDLDTLAAKTGETIMVLATTRDTDRGSFTNYTFNQKMIIAHYNQHISPNKAPANDIEQTA